jgi:opacity protein-like surface antigen
MRPAHHRLFGIALLFSCLLAASAAPAGELYLLGMTGISGGGGSNSVDVQSPVSFELSDDDVDSSPALGGAFGFQFLLGDVITRKIRLPEVIKWEPKLPNFNVRFEIEGAGGRDYELKTDGFAASTPYHSEVKSWSVMVNNWLELPVYPMVSAIRRIPALGPLSIQFGVGLGFAQNEVETSDSILAGSVTANNFAYQLGAGLGYDVTERFQIAIGYRRVEMGKAEFDLVDASGVKRGDFEMDLHSNEAVLTLKTNFYSLPWPHRSSRRMDW